MPFLRNSLIPLKNINNTPMSKFSDWKAEPENAKLLKDHHIPEWVANQIWDAAKVSAADEYIGLIQDGILIINKERA